MNIRITRDMESGLRKEKRNQEEMVGASKDGSAVKSTNYSCRRLRVQLPVPMSCSSQPSINSSSKGSRALL